MDTVVVIRWKGTRLDNQRRYTFSYEFREKNYKIDFIELPDTNTVFFSGDVVGLTIKGDSITILDPLSKETIKGFGLIRRERVRRRIT